MTTPARDSFDYARAKGWHIYTIRNANGEVAVHAALCPEHAGNQKRQTPPVNLEGQEPLF